MCFAPIGSSLSNAWSGFAGTKHSDVNASEYGGSTKSRPWSHGSHAGQMPFVTRQRVLMGQS